MRRLLITGFITVAACGGNGSSAVDARVAPCAVTPGTDLALEEIASGLERPVFVTAAPDDERVFIVEQPGRIRIFQNGALLPTPFLDLTARVRDSGNEQGLLGLAFHPQFPTNGRFYVNYTASD
ncbi:MAG TPA: PQQ-dependent sugar dehydrogenase, partial [Kofleriaceae bacterium]|nr:PQQ-dependent sugar dehydrogenase [Kofleriaceae bacterium]